MIWILGQALAPFADEDLIPAYGFGDSVTCDEDVFSFLDDEMPCHGFLEVLDHYTDIVKGITLGKTILYLIRVTVLQVPIFGI